MKYNVEDVFKTTGIPTITYVEPKEYLTLIVAMRSQGKCVVIEGPSGIGKTTAVYKAISDLGNSAEYKLYSARRPSDLPMIEKIADGKFEGIAIIDDFHRLADVIQKRVSDTMKLLADSQETNKKIVIIGINRVGDTLIKFSSDLNNRISTIRFEINDDSKLLDLIKKGEDALNIEFDDASALIENAHGSFHILQLMCQKACIQEKVISSSDEKKKLHFSYPKVSAELSEEFARGFFDIARTFATGNRLRREGRAPYLHVLKWLSESSNWSLDLQSEIQKHPGQKAGVIQIVEKGYLDDFLEKRPQCSEYIHFDKTSRILSVEDPKFMFYLKTLNWNNFARDIGYLQLIEEPKYDFALSFAGTERDLVKKVFERLRKKEIAVFYDENEQAEILSMNVEEYLYPIYNSEAIYVVPFLSKNYPNRIWTKFESKAFKERFGQNAVIPIWFDNVDNTMFDTTKDVGGIVFQTAQNESDEIARIVNLLTEKIEQYRLKRVE